MQNRREFLKTGGRTAAIACIPVIAHARPTGSCLMLPGTGRARDPDWSDLARRAVEAAVSAGATYADARLTATRGEEFDDTMPSSQHEVYGFGVRALVNGFWGFMSSAVMTADEAARLAFAAVEQARGNGVGKVRKLDLGPAPSPVTGEWTMPVKYDPFTISYGEKLDFYNDVVDTIRRHVVGSYGMMSMRFQRQYKTVATSHGSLFRQTTYRTGGQLFIGYRPQYSKHLESGSAMADFLTPAARGWEYLSESGIIEAIPALSDEAEQSRHVVPVDVGRFEAVCTPWVVAELLDNTLAAATELDRAMGLEANAIGTSYLGRPLEMLGSHQVGSSMLNVLADRSTPRALATVPYDDEGVEPVPFTLVKNGILADYQTSREEAPWLAPYYQKTGRPVRSHGCSRAENGLKIPIQFSPNVSLAPGRSPLTFEDMVAGTDKGIAIIRILSTSMDSIQLNGMCRPIMRQIIKGKLGPYIEGGGIQFRASELWKSLTALGGPHTHRWFGMMRAKGEPLQTCYHSIGAVPAKFSKMTVVDAYRRA